MIPKETGASAYSHTLTVACARRIVAFMWGVTLRILPHFQWPELLRTRVCCRSWQGREHGCTCALSCSSVRTSVFVAHTVSFDVFLRTFYVGHMHMHCDAYIPAGYDSAYFVEIKEDYQNLSIIPPLLSSG